MKITTFSNSKMGRLVARLLGKTRLDVKDGKVSLTDAEKGAILAHYGQAFLDKLESVDVEDDSDSALDLFNAAVDSRVAAATAAKDAQIASLQKDVDELSLEPEPSPAPTGAHVQPQAQQLPVNMKAAYNRVVAQALGSANPLAFAAMEDASINITDLNAEFSMTMPPRARLEVLSKRIYLGFEDSRYMTRVQSNTDYIATAAIMSEVSQQFTPKWTPKGKATFTPVRIPYRRHKINALIQPTDVLKSWLLYLYEQGKTQAEMPLTRYIIEGHIIPKVCEDITLSMLGKGKFVDAGTVADGDDGKPAAESMDGYETILVAGKTDEKCKINYYKDAVNPLTLGDQALLDYVNGFVDAISPMFQHIVTVHCSEQLLTKYKRADFAINGKYTGVENGGEIRFTNFRLVPLQSMYNSQIIFATPKENFVELVDYSRAERCINKIEEQNYDVKVFGEYSLSVGFKIQEAVFAAVPDGYDPSAAVMSGDSVDSSKWENGKAAASSTEAQEGA